MVVLDVPIVLDDPADAWLAEWAKAGADTAKALDNEALFPTLFRRDARLRNAILNWPTEL